MRTLHYRIITHDGERHPADARHRRYIYAFWHESLLFPTRLRTKAHVLISHHADGELITQVCRRLGFDVVRGSSTRGGARALRELIAVSRHSHLVVTPDGPRGPRRRVQPGVVFLASQTGLPIIPCGIAYQRCWRARSWDSFAVPFPGTRAVAIAGRPIVVPPGLKRKQLEEVRCHVEERMLAVTAEAEACFGGEEERHGSDLSAATGTYRRSA